MGAIDGVTEELADIAAGEFVEGIVLGDDVEVGLEGIVQELAQLAEFCADGGKEDDGAVHGSGISGFYQLFRIKHEPFRDFLDEDFCAAFGEVERFDGVICRRL